MVPDTAPELLPPISTQYDQDGLSVMSAPNRASVKNRIVLVASLILQACIKSNRGQGKPQDRWHSPRPNQTGSHEQEVDEKSRKPVPHRAANQRQCTQKSSRRRIEVIGFFHIGKQPRQCKEEREITAEVLHHRQPYGLRRNDRRKRKLTDLLITYLLTVGQNVILFFV